MTARTGAGGGGGAPALPWDRDYRDPAIAELRLRAPRSAIPRSGRIALMGAGVAALLLSLRFALIGAWPVLIFAVLDFGALAAALYLFQRSSVPEERFRVRDGEVELVRLDRRGRASRLVLPAYWTRIEATGRSELDHDLWLVCRGQRHPVGLCISAAERRRVEPQIRAALRNIWRS